MTETKKTEAEMRQVMTNERLIGDDKVLAFRYKYRGYRPWQLARVRSTDTMYEFTSYPWETTDGVYIMARVVEDPTTNRAFKVRREIALVDWGYCRQREYRAGWLAGQAYMRFVQAEYRKEKETK